MDKKARIDLTGKRFGMLTVLSYSHTKNNSTYWLCRCDCGNTKTVLAGNLVGSRTKSCGCQQRKMAAEHNKSHGESKTRLYRIWKNMRNRCYNPKVRSYKDYGARGVRVCEEWKRYEAFRDWAISSGYDDTLTIERIDSSGMYEPSNCKWIPKPDQGKNTSRIRYIEHNGKRMSLADWSKELGGGPNLVTTRLQRGWPEQDAVSIPPSQFGRSEGRHFQKGERGGGERRSRYDHRVPVQGGEREDRRLRYLRG